MHNYYCHHVQCASFSISLIISSVEFTFCLGNRLCPVFLYFIVLFHSFWLFGRFGFEGINSRKFVCFLLMFFLCMLAIYPILVLVISSWMLFIYLVDYNFWSEFWLSFVPLGMICFFYISPPWCHFLLSRFCIFLHMFIPKTEHPIAVTISIRMVRVFLSASFTCWSSQIFDYLMPIFPAFLTC